jgi:hypothetical protein
MTSWLMATSGSVLFPFAKQLLMLGAWCLSPRVALSFHNVGCH